MTQGFPERADPDALKDTRSHQRRWKAQGVALVKRGVLENALEHLKRTDHERLGKWHKVYPHPGEWDIVQDEPGCGYGLWFRPDGKMQSDCDGPDLREECKECICGFNDAVAALEEVLK